MFFVLLLLCQYCQKKKIEEPETSNRTKIMWKRRKKKHDPTYDKSPVSILCYKLNLIYFITFILCICWNCVLILSFKISWQSTPKYDWRESEWVSDRYIKRKIRWNETNAVIELLLGNEHISRFKCSKFPSAHTFQAHNLKRSIMQINSMHCFILK